MAILNFKQAVTDGPLKGWVTNFEEKILSGSKIHTIRKNRKNRIKVGSDIHFSTGARTKNYNQFLLGECTHVEKFVLDRWSNPQKNYPQKQYQKNGKYYMIRLGDHAPEFWLTVDQMKQFAVNDGFENLDQFLDWFDPLISNASFGYVANVIHWTDFRYK